MWPNRSTRTNTAALGFCIMYEIGDGASLFSRRMVQRKELGSIHHDSSDKKALSTEPHTPASRADRRPRVIAWHDCTHLDADQVTGSSSSKYPSASEAAGLDWAAQKRPRLRPPAAAASHPTKKKLGRAVAEVAVREKPKGSS